MKRLNWLVAALSLSTVLIAQDGGVHLKTRIPMPGIKGDFDHFAADVKGDRLYLAAEEHKSVEVFELKSGKHLSSISGFETPHAIVFSPEKNLLLVTDSGKEDGNEGYIRVVSLDSGKITDSIKVLAAADSAGYDPDAHRMFADTGGLEAKMDYTVISVIDTLDPKKLTDVKVDSARVEAITFEHNGSRMFANLRTKGQVGVFNKSDYKLQSTWPIPDATDNVPMALDEADHRLFVVTRKPAKLVVFDTESGKVVASMPAVGLADDMAYDPSRKKVYVSGGDGFVGVYAQKDPDHYEQVGHVPSGPRAKISIFIPGLNQLYVAASAKDQKQAELLIYDVQ
jgi:DNA-binding beta-propeller fold protein YncE